MKSNYDQLAETYDKLMGETGDYHHKNTLVPAILRLAGNVKGKKILNICCGNGYFDRQLVGMGAQVTGADISKILINIAKEKGKKLGITYFAHDACNPEAFKKYYERNYFDLVTCNMGILHLKNLNNFIKGVSSVLKPGGKFIFSNHHPFRPDIPYSRWAKGTLNGKKVLFIKTTGYLKERKETTPSFIDPKFKLTKYNRPLSKYINILTKNNFLIDGMIEPESIVGVALKYPEKLRESHHIPTFIIISSIKIK